MRIARSVAALSLPSMGATIDAEIGQDLLDAADDLLLLEFVVEENFVDAFGRHFDRSETDDGLGRRQWSEKRRGGSTNGEGPRHRDGQNDWPKRRCNHWRQQTRSGPRYRRGRSTGLVFDFNTAPEGGMILDIGRRRFR